MNYTKTIKAGGIEPVFCPGSDFFAVVLSPCDLLVKFPGQEWVLYAQGDWKELKAGKFDRLEIRNPTLAEITVIVYAGSDRYGQQRQSTIDAYTETVGSAVVAINNNASIAFPGTPNGKFIRRRCLIVSNEDPAARLRIRDAMGNNCSTIEPKSSQVIFSAGPLYLFNNSGGAVTFSASETWYVAT